MKTSDPQTRRLSRPVSLSCGALALLGACTFPDYQTMPNDGETSSAGSPGGDGPNGGIAPIGGVGGGRGGGSAWAGAEDMSSPPAVQPEPGALAGRYRFVARHSSKCVDAGGPAGASGAVSLTQHACDLNRFQAFVLADAGGGYYSMTIDGSRDCVDVQGQLNANPTPIARSACGGSRSQAWLPVAQDDGSYFLINRQTGKCIEVPSASLDDVALQQSTCRAGEAQGWMLASLDAQPLPLVVDDLFLANPWSAAGVLASGHDATACDGNRAPGARGDCHGFKLDSFPSDNGNVGATWLRPLGNWGNWPGVVVQPGAKRVRFQVRGAHGGETIRFNAASQQSGTFKDGFAIDYEPVTLSTSWREVSIDISGKAYTDGVISGFAYWVQAASNVTPIAFYIDDITWE